MVEGEISFGHFRLNIAWRELLRDETLLRLGSQARDILCVLGEADADAWLRKVSAPTSLDGARCGRLCRRQVYAALLGLPARR